MRWSLGVLLGLFGAACSAEDSSMSQPRATGLAPPVMRSDDETLLFNDANTGRGCALANLTQGCQCEADVSGRQLCGQNMVWGSCECLDANAAAAGAAGAGAAATTLGAGEPEANKLAASFDWLRTTPGGGGSGSGTCQPGHYAGYMDGIYNATSAFTAPVPVISIDVTGQPGLQLDLEESGNGEFLVVSGGAFNGTALAIFPFVGEFADGQLDCTTGEFRARIINGSYVVFYEAFYLAPTVYNFEGIAVARYDPQQRALVDGRWSVAEGGNMPPEVKAGMVPPLFPVGEAGGTGTWTAIFTP